MKKYLPNNLLCP